MPAYIKQVNAKQHQGDKFFQLVYKQRLFKNAVYKHSFQIYLELLCIKQLNQDFNYCNLIGGDFTVCYSHCLMFGIANVWLGIGFVRLL